MKENEIPSRPNIGKLRALAHFIADYLNGTLPEKKTKKRKRAAGSLQQKKKKRKTDNTKTEKNGSESEQEGEDAPDKGKEEITAAKEGEDDKVRKTTKGRKKSK